MSTGKNLVPKPKSESKARSRGGDREAQNGAVFSSPPPLVPPPRAAAVLPPAPPDGRGPAPASHGAAAAAPHHGPTTCVQLTVPQHAD